MSQRHLTLLPRRVDPLKFTQRVTHLQGEIHVHDLPRLQQCLSENVDALVFANLEFDRDEDNRRVMSGQLKTDLSVLCNRCLKPMILAVETGLNLAFVWNDEQAVALPKSLEPVFMGEDGIDLYEILEDELLLCLPLSPLHDSGVCKINTDFSGESDSNSALVAHQGAQHLHSVTNKTENPFEVLAQLKIDSGKKPE